MAEQYVDFNAVTTVASGGYTAGSGVLNVGSTSAPFPSTGTFRVVIQDQSTNATKVVLEITAVNSGTQWAVTSEGTDANASAGDNVYAVFTAAALNQVRADQSQLGTYSSRPSSGKIGDIYRCTDQPYGFRFNGTGWDAFDSPVILPAFNPSGFGWVNQGSATITASGRDQILASNQSGSGGDTLQAYLSGVSPAPAYTLTLQFSVAQFANYQAVSLILKATGTGHLITFDFFNIGAFQISQFTSETSYNTTVFAPTTTGGGSPANVYLRIVNDGSSHRTYFFSVNGVDFIQVYQESFNNYITENDWGIGFHLTSNASTSRSMARIRGVLLTNP